MKFDPFVEGVLIVLFLLFTCKLLGPPWTMPAAAPATATAQAVIQCGKHPETVFYIIVYTFNQTSGSRKNIIPCIIKRLVDNNQAISTQAIIISFTNKGPGGFV